MTASDYSNRKIPYILMNCWNCLPTHYIVALKRLNIILKKYCIKRCQVTSEMMEKDEVNKFFSNSELIRSRFCVIFAFLLILDALQIHYLIYDAAFEISIEFHFISNRRKWHADSITAMEMCDCLQAFHARWYYALYFILWICNLWILNTFNIYTYYKYRFGITRWFF